MICSQKRRPAMAHTQNRKKRQIIQKRAIRRGIARGKLLRLRWARTAACMANRSGVESCARMTLLYGCGWRSDLREGRCTGVGVSAGMNHLTGLRLGKTQLARHSIDAIRLCELCFGEPQLAVVFAQLVADLLLRFDAVGALDGAEVLEAVDHDERKQERDRGGKDAHFAHTHGVRRLDQPAIVKVLGKVELRRAHRSEEHTSE